MAWDLTWYRNSLLANISNEKTLQARLREDVPSVNILNNWTTNQQQSVNILNNNINTPNNNLQDAQIQALNKEVETWLWTRVEKVMSDQEKQKYLNSLSKEQYEQMLRYKDEWYWFMASKALLENSHKLADPTAQWLLKYSDYDKKDAYYNNTWDLNPNSWLWKFATWLQKTFGDQTPTEYLANWWNTKYGEKVARWDENFFDRFANITFGSLVNLLDSWVSGMMWIQDKLWSKLDAKLDNAVLWLDTDNKFYREMDTNLASDISKAVWSAVSLAVLWKFTAWHPLSMLKFSTVWATKPWEKVIDLTIWNIARLANWTLDTIPWVRAWYRQLDEQAQNSLVNATTLWILHGVWKYISPKVANTKVWNYVWEVRNAVRNGFERWVKQWVQNAKIQAEVEKTAWTKTYDYIDPVTWEKGTFDSFEWYDNRYRTRVANAGIQWFREWFWEWIYDEFRNVGSNRWRFGDNPSLPSWEPWYNPKWWPWTDWMSWEWSNNVNWNDNTNFVWKVKGDFWESQLATENRMTKGSITEFNSRYWQPYTQWLIDRWFTNSYENNIQPLIDYVDKVQQDKENILKLIDIKYKDSRVNKMLGEVLDHAEYVNAPELSKIQNLVLKNSQWWLTPSDVEFIRKYFSDYLFKDTQWKDAIKLRNIYDGVKNFLEEVADENWFPQLRELNKEISAWEHIIIWTTKRANGITANQPFGLKDAIILAWWMANPKTWSILWIRLLWKNPQVKDRVLNYLLKWRKPKEQKQIKVDFEKIIKQVEANKEADAQKQYEEFIKKWNIDTQPIENALWYNPEAWEFIDYSTPTVVWPEWRSKRRWQITELEPKTEIKRPWTTKPAEKIVDSVVKELVREWVLKEEVAETVKENLLDNLSQQAQEKLAEVEQKIENWEQLMEEEQKIIEKVADTIEDSKDELVIEREKDKIDEYTTLAKQYVEVTNKLINLRDKYWINKYKWEAQKSPRWKEYANDKEVESLWRLRQAIEKKMDNLEWWDIKWWDNILSIANWDIESNWLWLDNVKPIRDKYGIDNLKVFEDKKERKEQPKQKFKPMTRDDSDITWRFRNLTLEDYKSMQELEWKERELWALLEEDNQANRLNIIYKNAFFDTIEKLKGWFRFAWWDIVTRPEWVEIDVQKLINSAKYNMFKNDVQFYYRVQNKKTTKQDLKDYDYLLDEQDDEKAMFEKPEWNDEVLIEWIKDILQMVFEEQGIWWDEVWESYNPLLTAFFDTYRDSIEKTDYNKLIDKDLKQIKELIDKYWEYREPVEVKTQEAIWKTDTMNELQDKIKNIKTFDDFGDIFDKTESTIDLKALAWNGTDSFTTVFFYGKLWWKDVIISCSKNADGIYQNIWEIFVWEWIKMVYDQPIIEKPEYYRDYVTLEQIKAKLLNADDETIKSMSWQSTNSDYNSDNLQTNTTTNEIKWIQGSNLWWTSEETSRWVQGTDSELSSTQEIPWTSTMIQSWGSSTDSNKVQWANVSNATSEWFRPERKSRADQRLNNKQAKEILEKHNYNKDPNDYTVEELEIFKNYEWAGWLTNKWEDTTWVLDQFYTPQVVVNKTIWLAEKYMDKVEWEVRELEPTWWTGRMVKDWYDVTLIEIDKVPWTIAQILNPNANVIIDDFQNLFMDFTWKRPQEYTGKKFNLIAWNPPYKDRLTPQRANGEEPQIKRFEDYVMKKSVVDLNEEWGVTAMVMPSTFLNKPSNYAKDEILKVWTLVDAYRLPSWVFPNTNVWTDIVIFKRDMSWSNAINNGEWFKEHPEKVLWVEKTRIWRHGEETYIDWWENPLRQLERINVDNEPAIEQTKVKEYAKAVERTEQTEAQPKPKKTRTVTTKRTPTESIIKWDKNDLESKIIAVWDVPEILLEYQKKTNVDGFVEWVDPESDIKNLNYYMWNAQVNDLYFAWNIYDKLDQLELDKEYMTTELYEKQKKWLKETLPNQYRIEDIIFDPMDKELMETETEATYKTTNRDSPTREEITKNMTIEQQFMKYIDSLPYGSWLRTWEARKYLRWQKMEKDTKNETIELTKEFFNKFLREELDDTTKEKLVDKYNRSLRNYVRPKYEDIPLVLSDISKTFRGSELKLLDWQIRWINFLLSKWAWLVAHGVWHWKTMEWIVATVTAMNRWWSKKPLFIVPAPTLNDTWIATIKELYPTKEIVNLWWLTTADRKRLIKDLWPDPRNWIKDWQLAIITHDWFSQQLDFKPVTKDQLTQELKDVMEWEKDNVSAQEKMKEKIEMIIAWTAKTRKATPYTYTLPREFLKEMYEYMYDMDYENFKKKFVEDARAIPWWEENTTIEEQAEEMWKEKPVLIEDLWIDLITIDEAHNMKNIFAKAKMPEIDETWNKEINRFGDIVGSSSAIGRKAYMTSQYIMKRNNNRNVYLLTATPFNNQPIEAYNMLSLVGRKRLDDLWIRNINDFFVKFADFREDLVATPSWTWFKEQRVMKSFANLQELQRLVNEFIDYLWDRPDLIKPRKKLKKVVLRMSEKQQDVQTTLEALIDTQKEKWDVLKGMTKMRLNLISPYLVNGESPTVTEFIENSPKLKFVTEMIKELRAMWNEDGVFIYMPFGTEYHGLLKQWIAQFAWVDPEKIGIINWQITKEQKDKVAEQFRKWDINVLIWWSNTVEWIDLQNKWYITYNTLQWWNPTEITQLNGRIWRQWNFNNEVLEVLPLLENSADIVMMQKREEKESRINNIFEYQGTVFDTTEIDPQEEKLALLTNPFKKADVYMDLETKKIKKKIQTETVKQSELENLKEKEVEIKKIPEYEEWIEKSKLEGNEWRTNWYKDMLKKAKADEKWYNDKKAKINVDNLDMAIEESKHNIEVLEWEIQALKDSKESVVNRFEQEALENSKNRKTMKDYLEDLKIDFKNAQRFKSKQELEEWLNTTAVDDLDMIVEEPKSKRTLNSSRTQFIATLKPDDFINDNILYNEDLVNAVDKYANDLNVDWKNTLDKVKKMNKVIKEDQYKWTETKKELYDLKRVIKKWAIMRKNMKIKGNKKRYVKIIINQWGVKAEWHILWDQYDELEKLWYIIPPEK